MATNKTERMVTRRKRPDYFLLNGGSDHEALPEDILLETVRSEINSPINTPSSEILPSESISQINETTTSSISADSYPSHLRKSYKRPRPAPVTNWLWDYFEVTQVNQEWIVKRTKKRELIDQDIQCAYIDIKTGIQCPWKTSDSLQQTSTTNMQWHLEKHSIFSPHSQDKIAIIPKQTSIISLLARKETLTHQQLLEKNLLQWIINDKQAFTTIELPSF